MEADHQRGGREVTEKELRPKKSQGGAASVGASKKVLGLKVAAATPPRTSRGRKGEGGGTCSLSRKAKEWSRPAARGYSPVGSRRGNQEYRLTILGLWGRRRKKEEL